MATDLVTEGLLTLPMAGTGAGGIILGGLLYAGQKFGPIDVNSIASGIAGGLHFVNDVSLC